MGTLSSIIDRRAAGRGKSAENRKKFLERVRESVREAMPSILNSGNMKDIAKNGGKVEVKRKTIEEPSLRFGKGGSKDHVLPGNKEYVKGDKIKKGEGGGGSGGKKASESGSGEDPFIVQITREEFLEFFFEDLELPDLIRKDFTDLSEKKYKNAGFSTTGNPSKLAVVRSMKMAHLRKIALRGAQVEQIDALQEEKENLEHAVMHAQEEQQRAFLEEQQRAVEEKLQQLEEKKGVVPFIDPLDLRYRAQVVQEVPISHATMVCIMDNSGSMGEREKTLSRKFFYLLYLFLERKYEKISLHFISHTDVAKSVSEQEFFNTRESGGTIVSSALELLSALIPDPMSPSKTNIYVCQCSDGDNYGNDNEKCLRLLQERLMPLVQYWAYIQIEPERFADHEDQYRESADSLWGTYEKVSQTQKALALRHVCRDADIYPVFRKLFEKKVQGGSK